MEELLKIEDQVVMIVKFNELCKFLDVLVKKIIINDLGNLVNIVFISLFFFLQEMGYQNYNLENIELLDCMEKVYWK